MCEDELSAAVRRCGYHTQLYFGSVAGIAARVKAFVPEGKVLFIADEEYSEKVSDFRAALSPFRLFFVLYGKGERAAGLFSLPDDVRAAVAVGARSIAAARFFCTLRGAYCIAVPAERGARGIFEPCAEGYPSDPPAAVLFDESFAADRAAENRAWAAMSAAMAEDIDIDAVFSGERKEAGYAELRLAEKYAEGDARHVFAAAAFRALGERLAPACPSAAFASALGARVQGSDLRALVYAAERVRDLFRGGQPREYFVPDYASRAETAQKFGGKEVFQNIRVPTAAELSARARLFAESREHFCVSAELLLGYAHRIAEKFYADGGKAAQVPEGALAACYSVSCELSPLLSAAALARDFGLLPHMCGGA